MSKNSTPSPSALVQELQRLPPDAAIALVDRLLGPPEEWPSPLIAYRLTSEFQADWKAELGQWLKAAEQFGFLDRVLHEITHQAKKSNKKDTGVIDPNDPRHLKLLQHVAAARIIHYLTATRWSFSGYELTPGQAVDIDCALTTPNGQLVEFQVKAPDQPGRLSGHRYVDGDFDDRVITAVSHARDQLRRPPTGPAMIAVCANRSWGLAWEPTCLVHLLIGSTMQVDDTVYLVRHDQGFFSDDWKHVSGILLLDLLRGIDETKYTCTVLTNPQATFPVSPDWFPKGRVCVLEGTRFRWVRGQPGNALGLVDGTRWVERLP
jgi:hypothetical protein